MELRFWGVRGSIPVPGPHTTKVGGNTTCVSVQQGDRIVVFDAGTGLRQLGRYLEDRDRSHWKGSVFLTHYHWDHIQGLPFFEPGFRSEHRFHMYGEQKRGFSIQKILSEQMQPPYFPVSFDALEGLITFIELRADLDIEVFPGAIVRTVRLTHPDGALGYRFDSQQGSLCFVTDHEHPTEGLSESVVDSVRGAAILIHDAQYTPEEKRRHRAGWGHSSWEEAALTAREAGVKRLFLIHHDPDRLDRDVAVILQKARRVFRDTEIAKEGSVYDFEEDRLRE